MFCFLSMKKYGLVARYDKGLDGVLILTLIHGLPMVPTENFKLPSFLVS